MERERGPGPLDETEDAVRRTRLANERTYLAWWRSGLTALAVSFGAGKVVPELAGGARWPFEAVGGGFGVLGTVFLAYGLYRHRRVEAALRRGEFPSLDDRVSLALTMLGVALGAATVVLVLVQG